MLYTLKNRKPTPCEDFITWSVWMQQNSQARIVHQSRIGAWGFSTAFVGVDLGINHNPPFTFETLVGYNGEPRGDLTTRYTSWELADEGHRELIRRCSAL